MLEGLRNDSWWDWKDTLGPLKDRPGFQGVWGYQQTHGLGMMEYLEWAEDMGLEIGKQSDSNCTEDLFLTKTRQSSVYGLVLRSTVM
jgi:hypothetical protein